MFFVQQSSAQIISQFNWNSNPITNAVVGPNASSAGLTATSSAGGVGGTNGLNPGSPSPASDINLTIPNTGNVFDIPNIDISIDYRRNESTAEMIKRGSFTFNTGTSVANFRVTYRVTTGTVVTTVTSSNVAIPLDATFRNYRFTYDNCTGIGTMYVNSAVVWTCSPTTPGQNLYWVGDGSIIIGSQMDGANNNVPNLDNFLLQTYTCSTVLPIELVNFTGQTFGTKNRLQWISATEKNNDYYSLERSTDGVNWITIHKIIGAGNSTKQVLYKIDDLSFEPTLNYYRLKQTDFDGQSTYFKILVIDNSTKSNSQIIKITDLLGRVVPFEFEGPRLIFYSNGTVEKQLN